MENKKGEGEEGRGGELGERGGGKGEGRGRSRDQRVEEVAS